MSLDTNLVKTWIELRNSWQWLCLAVPISAYRLPLTSAEERALFAVELCNGKLLFDGSKLQLAHFTGDAIDQSVTINSLYLLLITLESVPNPSSNCVYNCLVRHAFACLPLNVLNFEHQNESLG